MRSKNAALQCLIAVLVVAIARPPVAVAAPPSWLPPLALGVSGPRISVVVVSLDAKAAAQQGALEGAALDALDRATRFTVLAPHDAFNPGAFKKRQENVDAANAKVKAGKQALDDLDNVKATEAFTQAVEALQGADLSHDFPALLDAWTMKAAGHATGGENGPAKKDMEAVIALAPRSEFSPTFFPPDLLKYSEAQRKLATNAKGELLVRTEPPGARVWVDGQYRGVSPVTVAGLSAGKHFVAASLGGYALGQSQATPGEEVLSLAAAELGPGWKKAITDIKKDPEGSTRDAAAQALGKAASLDQLVLVVAKKSVAGEKLELIGLRLESRDGHNASFGTATLSAGDPEALTTFFDSLTGRDAKRDGKDAVHHFKGGGSSSVKTIAGVSLLGLGAAGLIAGGVLGGLALGNADIYRKTPQTQTGPSSSYRAEGQFEANAADVSMGLGLVAAGVGAVLLLTNGGGDAAPQPADKPTAKNDDAKRREADRRAAEERRAAEDRRREDERRREDDKKREEERRKENEAKAAEDKRRADEDAAAKKKAEDDASKKLSKKEREALEKKQREDEAKQKKEEEAKRKEEEKARKDEEARAAAEEKKRAEEEKKASPKLTKKQQREEDERKKREEEEAAKKKAEEEEARLKAEAEKKKRDEEERKKREAAEKKKKEEDHDDLRNY